MYCILFSIILPNIIRLSTSSRIIRIRLGAQVRQEMHTVYESEVLKGRDHVEDAENNRRIILRWIFKNRVGRYRVDLFG